MCVVNDWHKGRSLRLHLVRMGEEQKNASRLATGVITKRRTRHGHLQCWFVPARAPLTPLAVRPPERRRQQGWSKYNQRWGVPFWRAGRGGRLRRPCRPGRSFSDRAPSLREIPKPCAPLEHVLLQSGTHFDACQPLFAEHDPVCLTTLPPCLDEFGSNELLFASTASARQVLVACGVGNPHPCLAPSWTGGSPCSASG